MCGYRARCSLSAAAKSITSTSFDRDVLMEAPAKLGRLQLKCQRFQLYSAVLDLFVR